MIHGTIDSELQATIALRVRAPSGNEVQLDAIIDTAYTGTLTLPYDVVASLGLIFHSELNVTFADGSTNRFDVFTAEIEWDGVWQSIQISQVGSDVLLGMKLLENHELRAAVIDGGTVEIIPIP